MKPLSCCCLLIALAASGCSKVKTDASGSSSAAAGSNTGGIDNEYADAVCKCQNSECVAEAAKKYKGQLTGTNGEANKRVADCVAGIVKQDVRGGQKKKE